MGDGCVYFLCIYTVYLCRKKKKKRNCRTESFVYSNYVTRELISRSVYLDSLRVKCASSFALSDTPRSRKKER